MPRLPGALLLHSVCSSSIRTDTGLPEQSEADGNAVDVDEQGLCGVQRRGKSSLTSHSSALLHLASPREVSSASCPDFPQQSGS